MEANKIITMVVMIAVAYFDALHIIVFVCHQINSVK